MITLSKIRLSLTYQEMYQIKHALQMYTTRDNPLKDDDIQKETELIDLIDGYIKHFEKWANIAKPIESEDDKDE
jgi:hypothetical protein